MTVTDSTIPEAPLAQDHLAGAIVRSLKRPLIELSPWGPVRTLVVGVVTFGIYPLIAWSRTLTRWMRFERQQLWHLGEWMRLHTGHDEATPLRDSADRIKLYRGLTAVAMLCLVAVVGVAWMEFSGRALSLNRLLDQTYHYPSRWRSGAWSVERVLRSPVFATWTIGLSLAYLLHAARVQLHALDVRRFAARMNQILSWEGVELLTLPKLSPGLSISWIVGAIAMVWAGAWWGAPLMLAGAAQARYTSETSSRLRRAMADRVQLMLQAQRPRRHMNVPVVIGGFCRETKCRAPLPTEAEFCPRCGTRQRTILSEVA